MTDIWRYFQKAAKYELLTNFYKHIDPEKHLQCYQKHVHYLNLANKMKREKIYKQPSYVRFLCATDHIGKIDIYLNGKRVLKDIDFKKISQYITLPTGKYHIDIYPAGTQLSTLINKTVDFKPNTYYTLTIVGSNNKYQLIQYFDKKAIESPITSVRFINLRRPHQHVDVKIKNDKTLFTNVAYMQATDYISLTPMTGTIEIMDSITKEIIKTYPNITLKPNLAYSLVLIDGSLLLFS
ncbi:hypothetical protein B5V89_08400 [Heyndrickxia sporothermodurans]|uniref:DUF4397 domain-containing protein n=1 Tax=Heyndrickxia TaxID=2837504 RepID=UPI000D346862|nr:DUF4397 domain-containing protein [Heyndrickxia sporothermodurans]PTY78759.1 hypothetical protein B5V89_08400 [Heyndrickxia sporothermodurans]